MSTATKSCPVCGSATREHCEGHREKPCGWWRCPRCKSFGDERKHVEGGK